MAGRRRRREDEETSYWLSYSDMMAGLLLMFVIIISFTMMQSKLQYEEDARQLRAQQETLEEQQTTLEEQQNTMETQHSTLLEQEEELASKQQELESQKETLQSQTQQLTEQQKTLEEQQKTLEEQQKTLKEQTQQLEEQKKKLKEQQKTLKSQTKQLEEQQKTTDAQQKALDEKQKTVDEQSAQLEAQQLLLDEQTQQLESQQTELKSQTKQLKDQQDQIENQQHQMQALIGIRSELVEELREAFEGTTKVSVDSKTGAIMFDSNVLFDFNKSLLREEGEDFLEDFFPEYFNILLSDEFKDYVSEVIIEGHTDTDGGYIDNLELSQQRALAVARYCLEDESGILDEGVADTLRQIVTCNGKSYSNPVYNEDGTINMDASRRVEVKFRLKEDEMVDQMMEILNSVEESEAET